MIGFTELEKAALLSILSETPELATDLERQLARAIVTKRENTGGGFLTTIVVPEDAPQVCASSVLGYKTHARVRGLEHGFGFVLFLSEGRMHLLDGHAWGPESTASLDLFDLTFEIYNAPIQHIG